ncbi:MAG: hypothetical protein Q8L48_05865 [Archangium sp.]|nr:hypothetical protein [Archangium sp.]
MNMDSPLSAAVALIGALVLLRFQAWRAVLCLRPQSVRVEVDTPADVTAIPPELEDTWGELKKLGFTLLGAHTERAPLTSAHWFLDAVHPTHPVVASLCVSPDEQDHLVFLTQSERGFVITANYRRLSFEVPGAYLAGGLDGATPERLLKAHLRRVPEIGAPKVLKTIEERVVAAREWYSRSGKPELRQQHAVGLLWTLGAVGMVGAALFRLVA